MTFLMVTDLSKSVFGQIGCKWLLMRGLDYIKGAFNTQIIVYNKKKRIEKIALFYGLLASCAKPVEFLKLSLGQVTPLANGQVEFDIHDTNPFELFDAIV